EDSTMFAGAWKTPMSTVDAVLFQNSFLKLPLFFFVVLITLFLALQKKGAKTGRAMPMDRVQWASIGAILLFVVYGWITGGHPWQAGWQLYMFVTAFMFSKLLIATMQKPEHFVILGKVILAAAIYRAFIGLCFWFGVVHNQVWPKGPPAHMTTHGDTALF